jgi:glycosyltransferase involved in cell wall biosynthesis
VSGGKRISVVIPVRDGERYIAEALDTVLGQTEPPGEVVVVDDGSTDGTVAAVEAYAPAVRCLARPAEGIGAALNTGISACGGELLAFLDADDLWAERKLELQLRALDGDPAVDLVFGHVEQFVSPELTEEERAKVRLTHERAPGLLKGAMLARRPAFDRVGGFGTGWVVADFIDWYGRSEDAGLRSLVLPDVVLRRRIHTANTGLRRKDARQDYARAMGDLLRRRRAAGGGEG